LFQPGNSSDIEQKGALLVKHFVELGKLVTKRTAICFVARVDFPLFSFFPGKMFSMSKRVVFPFHDRTRMPSASLLS